MCFLLTSPFIEPAGARYISEDMLLEGQIGYAMKALRFAGKFVLAISGILVSLWIVGESFALSRWVGSAALAAVAVILYVTAPRWVAGLPGILIFGVVNALLALAMGHVPTNPHAPVSRAVIVLVFSYYVIGCVVSYRYDITRLSPLDRLAVLLYLCCAVWPAVDRGASLDRITPAMVWSAGIGIGALLTSFAIHRARPHGPTNSSVSGSAYN